MFPPTFVPLSISLSIEVLPLPVLVTTIVRVALGVATGFCPKSTLGGAAESTPCPAVTVTGADLAAYDVDHLLNRARAGNDNSLLRIEASPLGVNRQWGSVLEKLASQATVAGNQRTRRLMSYLIAAKVAGFAPPTTLQDPVSRARLVRELASLGIPQKDAQDGLDVLLGHIARNLR